MNFARVLFTERSQREAAASGLWEERHGSSSPAANIPTHQHAKHAGLPLRNTQEQDPTVSIRFMRSCYVN